MKKILVLTTILLSSITFARAQSNDPKATLILDGVSAKYKALKTVQAEFTLKIENGQSTAANLQSGTIYIKDKKYKIVLKNQEIISDNTTVWTYLKEANEVQVNNYEEDESSITPSQIFTIYEKDFLYAFIEEKVLNGKTLQYIELTPVDKSKPYFKIRLAVDKAAKSIQSAVVFDKNGNRYTYEIKSFTPNPELADTFFSFDSRQHPGVEVVDLR